MDFIFIEQNMHCIATMFCSDFQTGLSTGFLGCKFKTNYLQAF